MSNDNTNQDLMKYGAAGVVTALIAKGLGASLLGILTAGTGGVMLAAYVVTRKTTV